MHRYTVLISQIWCYNQNIKEKKNEGLNELNNQKENNSSAQKLLINEMCQYILQKNQIGLSLWFLAIANAP